MKHTSSRIYKTRTKAYHDKFISRKIFKPNQKVWLYNSRLRLFIEKLRSCWDGPYIITQVFPHGAIEIKDPKQKNTFKVNGQRLKHYMDEIRDGEQVDSMKLQDLVYNETLAWSD